MTLQEFLTEWNNGQEHLHVHTSGSTGVPKDIVVEKKRMLASATMTCDALGLKPGDNALLCMPLDYIAGKMMVVRSIERQLNLIDIAPSSHPLKTFTEGGQHIHFAAFVPLQVVKTLENKEERRVFESIDNVIIGGGAIDDNLERVLAEMPNNVYSTYGMTETLSHIALRRISGKNASLWYTPMPGVCVSLADDSCLTISAPTVCSDILRTNDIAEINDEGRFRIIGRKDNTINTGGVKVQIEEVERLLRNEGIGNVLITSAPDTMYGEIIVLLADNNYYTNNSENIEKAITTLPRYWRPKRIVTADELPMTETGKPDRAKAKTLAIS